MTVYVRIVVFDIHIQYICLRFRLPCVGVSYSILIPENFMHLYLVRVLACVSHKTPKFFGPVKFSGVSAWLSLALGRHFVFSARQCIHVSLTVCWRIFEFERL